MPRPSLLVSGVVACLFAALTAQAAPARHAQPGPASHRPATAPKPGGPSAGAGQLIAPDPKARQLHAVVNLMDLEGKGYVTEADFLRTRSYAARLYGVLDRNGDGTVDRREFLAGHDGLRTAEFARLDRNKDGHLTQQEFLRGWTPELFQALSHGRSYLTAGDLRPGFGTTPPPAPPPAVVAAAPTPPERNVFTQMGSLCWYPINRPDRWGLTFPLGPGCR